MSNDTLEMVMLAGIIWLAGFMVVCLGYYHGYRREGPDASRLIAAVLWPIGIPADLLYRRLRK